MWNFEHVLIFLCSTLFFRYENIEHKKIKTRSELTTLSLSVFIIMPEISRMFHDDDTEDSHYDDKTAILLFLRAFKLFSQQF